LQLAAEAVAKAANGSIRVEMLYEDNESDPKKGAAAAQNILRQNVDVVISVSTAITSAIAPLVVSARKILLYAAASREIAKQSPLFFRDYYDAEDHGEAVAAMLLKRNKSRVAYMGEENDACTLYRDAMQRRLGMELLASESYSPGDADLAPSLLRIKGRKPDAIAFCTWRDTSLVMKRMSDLGMLDLQTFHFVGPFLPVSDTPEVRELLEKNHAATTWYANVPSEESGATEAFRSTYREKFGEEPRGDAKYLYDDITFLAEAAKSCPQSDLECIAAYLKQHPFVGVAGMLRFDENRVSKRAVTIQELRGGAWQVIAE